MLEYVASKSVDRYVSDLGEMDLGDYFENLYRKQAGNTF